MPKKTAMKGNCAAINVDHFRYEFPSFKRVCTNFQSLETTFKYYLADPMRSEA